MKRKYVLVHKAGRKMPECRTYQEVTQFIDWYSNELELVRVDLDWSNDIPSVEIVTFTFKDLKN